MKITIISITFLLLLSSQLVSARLVMPTYCWIKPRCLATSYNNGQEWVDAPSEVFSAEEEAAENALKRGWSEIGEEGGFEGLCCMNMNEAVPTLQLPSPIVSDAFQIYQESETYMLEIPPLTVKFGNSLWGTVAGGVWNGATAAAGAIPEVGPAISVFMSVLGGLGLFGSQKATTEPTSINVTALFDRLAQQVETWDEEYDFGETLNSMRRKYTAMTEDLEQALSLEDAALSYPYYVDIDAELTSLLLDFEEDPSLYDHAYFTFQLLFLEATLHIEVKNMLALDALWMNQTNALSDAAQFLDAGQKLYETYGQLLLNFSSNVTGWRLKFIDDITCNDQEVNDEEAYNITYSFSDNFTQASFSMGYGYNTTYFYGYFPISCKHNGAFYPIIYGPSNADSLLKQARTNYINAIQSGTTKYLNNYLLAFSQIGAQFPSVNQQLVQQLACGMSCNPYA